MQNAILNQKLKTFFLTHPGVDIVFVALGVLFQDLENANKYLGGVADKTVTTFTRKQVDELLITDGEAPIEEPVKNASEKEKQDAINAMESETVRREMDKTHTQQPVVDERPAEKIQEEITAQEEVVKLKLDAVAEAKAKDKATAQADYDAENEKLLNLQIELEEKQKQ